MAVAAIESARQIGGGVDIRKDVRVAAAFDVMGRLPGAAQVPATLAGYRALLAWLAAFDLVPRAGVAGAGAWVAGLAPFLRAAGIEVVEMDRPKRQRRRRRGKSGPAVAEAAAGAVLAPDVSGSLKVQDDEVEVLRALQVAHRSIERRRIQVTNQPRSPMDTAPATLREQLCDLRLRQFVERPARHCPGDDLRVPLAATRAAPRRLACHWLLLIEVVADLKP